jgi:hypothetical protein
VPIGRAWRHSSNDVLCVCSVRRGRAQIGSYGAPGARTRMIAASPDTSESNRGCPRQRTLCATGALVENEA